MSFSAKNILFYSEKLYESALRSMADEEFRKADTYAICAYSAANLLLNDSELGELREQVQELREASFQLSSKAYYSSRVKTLEPRVSGSYEMESEHFKMEMDRLVKEVFGRKKA
jgi:hypothetical protein